MVRVVGWAVCVSVSFCAACGSSDTSPAATPPRVETPEAGPTEPPGPPPLSLSTTPIALGPGVDRDRQCQVFTLHNDEELLLQRVELTSTSGMHHSDWFVMPDTTDLGRPDGNGPCTEFAQTGEHDAAPASNAFSQSTQSRYEEQSFGEHVAFPIPPHSRFYVKYHMLNTTDAPLDVSVTAKLHFALPETVNARLVLGGAYLGLLAVPARQRSRFYSECRFVTPTRQTGYFVIPHYHEYGTGLFVELLGGPRDGERIWDSEGSIGEGLGARIAPPAPFEGALGVRFGCTYDNTTDRTLVVGNEGNEMCSFSMHTDGAAQWYGVAGEPFSNATVVDRGKGADGVQQFEVTNCVVLGGTPE